MASGDNPGTMAERRQRRLLAGQDPDELLEAAGKFFLARAEKEHESAERKREAAMTKATAIAALAAALAAIVATPTLDGSGLGDWGRWLLLAAVVSFLAAIGCVAVALLIHVRPGERVSRLELTNWTSEQFWLTDVVTHSFDLTNAFVTATNGIRRANKHAEWWLSAATAAIAAGLVLLLAAFGIETA